MKDPIVNIESLSFEIDGKLLLKDVSLTLTEGEHVALVGVNGAGKSTLFRSILKLVSVAKSSISLGGHDISKLSRYQIARFVSYVPQSLSLSVDYTVAEYLQMSCFSQTDGQSEQAMHEVLERLQLVQYEQTSVMDLSGGERQRVSIAAAIVQGAKVMLLDEPTAHLDLYQAAKVKSWLQEVAKQEELTTITITHDLNWVAADFDRVVCLKDGSVCYDGVSKGLLTKDALSQMFGILAEIVNREGEVPFIVHSTPVLK